MKVALISDIHANLFALEAVLAHAQSQGIKNFWCMGDLVHFNAFPQEVVKTIRKLDAACIYGNIDKAVLDMRKMFKKKAKEKDEKILDGLQPIMWTYSQLTKRSREYLADLPVKRRLKIAGNKFLLIHGSPAAFDDPIYIDTPDDRLKELSRLTNAEFVIIGHTHKPFVREVDGVTFINPGSVGKPIDGDPRASYAVLKIKKNSVSVEPHRVEYNLGQALDAMREEKLPELFIRSLELSLGHDKVTEILKSESQPEAEE